jgi:ubiquitin-protein ligase
MDEPQKVIKMETCKRLLKDVRQIIKNPLTDNGIYYSHDEIDMTKGYAMIVGPSDTPYFGGFYFFKFDYPFDYPFSPPKVTYMTNDGLTRFNPNLYKCGKVCVSILNTWSGDKWSACQTINSILLTLCSLLNDSPLANEPGQEKGSRDFIPYQKSIEFKNIDFAICDLLNRTNYIIPSPFELFYPFMKQHFNNNYDKLIEYVQSKNNEVSTQSVSIYGMHTKINYSLLENKLVNIKKILDAEPN